MLFNSYVFIFVFLPITLSVFFLLGHAKKRQLALLWLVITSFFFYAWSSPQYLGVMLFSLIVNYLFAIRIQSENSTIYLNKKMWLTAGILFNLSMLIFYKYINFLMDIINYTTQQHFSHWEITLPLAISFFTFQQIAFLVDLYKKQAEKTSILKYCLFIAFFPQLIAGPIVHHKEMMPQFENKKIFSLNRRNVAIGITIFFMGLLKKVGIADNIAPFANEVFHLAKIGVTPTFWEAWVGAWAYSFQLYFDFSGYSDMAIGLARMFSIHLPMNFNSPYKAKSIIDFWRRWHITLSRFLRDYVYIPLGGNQRSVFSRYQNVMITMLLGGLWHGAGLHFLLWGGLHGMYLMINHAWVKYSPSLLTKKILQSQVYQYICMGITFLAVVLAWVLFRAEDFASALKMYRAMLGIEGIQLPVRLAQYSQNDILQKFNSYVLFEGIFHNLAWTYLQVMPIFCLFLIVLLFPNTQTFMRNGHLKTTRSFQASTSVINIFWKPSMLWAGFLSVITIICLTLLSKPSEFLYYQF